MTAELLATRQKTVLVHPMLVRITHWVNALAMIIMIGSGWRIWNSEPIFDYYFPVWLTIGGDPARSQDLHNELGLASALQWHFAAMWLLVVNGLIYFFYGLLSGHFHHVLLPVSPRVIFRDFFAALRFRLAHRPGVYNAVQRALYIGVLAAGIVMVWSGLAIWKPGQFQELAWLLGGFDTARLVHFFGMCAIVAFLVVHIGLVIIVPRTLPTMITGRAAVDGNDAQQL
jgi:thiosulfate reductase cytochrome b subunit